MKYWRGFLVAGILAAITLGLQWLAKRFTQLVDMVYPFLTREIQGFLAGWSGNVDFTVWQVLVMLIVAVLAASIVLMIVLKWNFFQWMGWILAGASMIWLLHTGIYGLNYYASPLSQDIRMGDYSAYVQENLEDATLYFLSQANELAKEMPRDEQGNLQTGTFQELAVQAGSGFETLVFSTGAVFGGNTSPVKELAWADFYTSMGITGVHMPITGEAAVNPQTPAVSLPYTMCHEMAHRMCIATENDANFAAFLACLANEDPAFRYSAYFMAYRYCYNALMAEGTADAVAAAARIDLQVNAYLRFDMKKYDHFFSSHRNETLSVVGDTVNDTYIKVSGDEQGTASYGKVSDLLVNWYIEEMVIPYMDQEEENPFDPMDKDYIGGILEGIG